MCDIMKRYEEQAAAEGCQEGEQLLSTLIQTLILSGKQAEIGIVTSDVKVRQEYYKKYYIC